MTSLGLVEMFKGDVADMCTDKFPLVLMVGQAECRHTVSRYKLRTSRKYGNFFTNGLQCSTEKGLSLKARIGDGLIL